MVCVVLIKYVDLFGCVMIWKNSQLIKKAKIRLKGRDMRSVLSALLYFFETKQVKSGPGKY